MSEKQTMPSRLADYDELWQRLEHALANELMLQARIDKAVEWLIELDDCDGVEYGIEVLEGKDG